MGQHIDGTPLFIPFLFCQRIFDIAKIVLLFIELSIKQNACHIYILTLALTPHTTEIKQCLRTILIINI